MREFVAEFFVPYLPRYLNGAWVTVWLTAASILIGSLLGLLAAIFKVARIPVLRQLAEGYTWFFRGTPLLVQIAVWYYGFGLYPKGLAAIVALSVNAGAYITEIIRAGIESIDRGQWEAARSLGMSYKLAMRRIILPQAYKRLLPPMANEFIALLKDSSLVSVIGMVDLLRVADQINAQKFKALEAYLVAAFFYLVLTTFFTILAHYVERKVGAYEQ